LSDLSPVEILEDRQGQVHWKGVSSHDATSSEALAQLLSDAMSSRTTASTERNEVSSRSHAILRLVIHPADSQSSGSGKACGRLTLVDLAGSERASERGFDVTPELLAESIEINKALMSLKECMRSMITGSVFCRFRASFG